MFPLKELSMNLEMVWSFISWFLKSALSDSVSNWRAFLSSCWEISFAVILFCYRLSRRTSIRGSSSLESSFETSIFVWFFLDTIDCDFLRSFRSKFEFRLFELLCMLGRLSNACYFWGVYLWLYAITLLDRCEPSDWWVSRMSWGLAVTAVRLFYWSVYGSSGLRALFCLFLLMTRMILSLVVVEISWPPQRGWRIDLRFPSSFFCSKVRIVPSL